MATLGFHASHEQIIPGRLLKDVQLAEQAGFDELYLHFVGQQQAPFIHAFAEHVLPQLCASGTPRQGREVLL